MHDAIQVFFPLRRVGVARDAVVRRELAALSFRDLVVTQNEDESSGRRGGGAGVFLLPDRGGSGGGSYYFDRRWSVDSFRLIIVVVIVVDAIFFAFDHVFSAFRFLRPVDQEGLPSPDGFDDGDGAFLHEPGESVETVSMLADVKRRKKRLIFLGSLTGVKKRIHSRGID